MPLREELGWFFFDVVATVVVVIVFLVTGVVKGTLALAKELIKPFKRS